MAGAVAGLFFALPAAILQRTVFSGSAWGGLMFAVVLFSGALAGYGAGRAASAHTAAQRRRRRRGHLRGAELVYLIVRPTVPNPIGLVFGLLLFASLGTIGGYIADWARYSGVRDR